MRVVHDTNVVLSALLWRGTPYHLLTTISHRPWIHLYSSSALLDELADVLARASSANCGGPMTQTAAPQDGDDRINADHRLEC